MGTSFSKKGDMSILLRHAAQTMTEFSEDYDEFAQWKKSTEGSPKMTQASIASRGSRKCELEVTQEQSSKRRYEPSWRQQQMEGDSDSDDYLPARISSSPNKRPRKLHGLPMAVQMTTGGRISISKPDWMKASAKDRTLIQDWNSRVKNSDKRNQASPNDWRLQERTTRSSQDFNVQNQLLVSDEARLDCFDTTIPGQLATHTTSRKTH
jgi:hypothetical protein